MLWFMENHTKEPTREQLIQAAARYFYKHQFELTSGTVKGKLGILNITVSFTVNEEER